MSEVSVKTIVQNCLGKTPPLSLRRDVLGVYGSNNIGNSFAPEFPVRSLKHRLNLIKNKPFVRLALVTVRREGAAEREDPLIQRDLDAANEVYQKECDAWIYCVASVHVHTNHFGPGVFVHFEDCDAINHDVSQDEADLFSVGRDLGAEIVGYFIGGSNINSAGCGAPPPDRRGFWINYNYLEPGGISSSPRGKFILAHELSHVVGHLHHLEPPEPDNLMNDPDVAMVGDRLNNEQRTQILNDPAVENC